MYLTENGELYDENGKADSFIDIKKGKSDSHFFLIDENKDLYTWGWNGYGQLGTGGTNDVDKPTILRKSLFNNSEVLQVEGGFKHSIVLNKNHEIFVWGCNYKNKLGFEDKKNSIVIKPKQLCNEYLLREKIVQIASGGNHFLSPTERGEVYSWGLNGNGQLGLGFGGSVVSCEPHLINPGNFKHKKIVQVACGISHSLALTEDGEVYSWGKGEMGELGHGDFSVRREPKQVRYKKRTKRLIDDIWEYSAVETTCGVIYGWGNGRASKPELLNL